MFTEVKGCKTYLDYSFYTELNENRIKEWMKLICPCFTQSQIALTESARETLSLPGLAFNSVFLSPARDCMTFTLHDLTDYYVESVTAHHIKINDNSCFHNCWPNSKTNQKLKHL